MIFVVTILVSILSALIGEGGKALPVGVNHVSTVQRERGMTELNFRGKEFVRNHHLTVPFRPLVPQPEKGIGPVDLSGNLIIHGDNLHALKALMPMYAGKVDVIFIDPPYNTGYEGWAYNDNVNSPMIKDWLGKEVGIDDALRHDKWCAMMWPRLVLLRELLSDDGAIFICIDNNETHHVRMLCDEIFGQENFRNEILIRRGVKNVQAQFEEIQSLATGHDTLYLYTRNSARKLPKLSVGSSEEIGKWDTFWRGTDRGTMRYSIFGVQPDDGQWRWSKSRAEEAKINYDEFLAHFSTEMSLDDFFHLRTQELGKEADFLRINDDGVVQYFVPPRSSKLLSDVWLRLATSGKFTDFEHEKGLPLVETAIAWMSKTDSIILDSFVGSGTTAHATLNLNRRDGGSRRFIGIETESYAETLTAPRVKRAVESIAKTEGGLGLGAKQLSFTFCEIGPPINLDAILKGEQLPAYEALGSALFHMITNTGFDPKQMAEGQSYLGSSATHHVWMLYKPDLDWLKSPAAALTLDGAKVISASKADGKTHYVIAATRYVSDRLLREENIPVEFVPLPYALYRIGQA